MNKEKEHIKILLERFWNGSTTNEEEKELYRYFSNKDIPENMKPYRSLFSWFENELPEELTTIHTELPIVRIKHISWKIISGIAALIILILGTSFYFLRQTPDLYEGSYIVRNGVRITDLKEIRPELQKTESFVLKQVKQIKNNAATPQVNYKMNDELRLQMQRLIEDTPQGWQRNMVEEIITDFINI
ncbi:MAG: hypothetical protein ACLSC9_10235 [Barnesiella sp.]